MEVAVTTSEKIKNSLTCQFGSQDLEQKWRKELTTPAKGMVGRSLNGSTTVVRGKNPTLTLHASKGGRGWHDKLGYKEKELRRSRLCYLILTQTDGEAVIDVDKSKRDRKWCLKRDSR